MVASTSLRRERTPGAVTIYPRADRLCPPRSRLRHSHRPSRPAIRDCRANLLRLGKEVRLGVSELRPLRQLEEENSRLKRRGADLSLDTDILSETGRASAFFPRLSSAHPVVSSQLLGELCAGLWGGSVQSSRAVSEEPRGGSNSPADADSRSGPCPTPVRLCANLGVAPARGWLVNRKRARRLYPWPVYTCAAAGAPTQTYLDVVHDTLADSRPYWIFTLVEQWNCSSPVMGRDVECRVRL